MSNYWLKRQAKIQEELNNKTIKQTEKQLIKYYANAARKVIKDFEETYNKLLATVGEGKEPTPADLYKLDKYWAMQAQLRQELNKLGEKEVSLLTKNFELHFFEVYYSLTVEGSELFSTVDNALVNQMINSSWCLDGKNFSQRIWDNTERLAQTLNDNLIHCVATGKKPTELIHLLEERFGVSYNRANMLVRTEIAHIQSEAAKKRYADYGVEFVEFSAIHDDRTCEKCKELDGKIYPVNAAPAVPIHPNGRCAILPVIE
jgi:SPP1 gp7 family putative phage head morphogenesis protein